MSARILIAVGVRRLQTSSRIAFLRLASRPVEGERGEEMEGAEEMEGGGGEDEEG